MSSTTDLSSLVLTAVVQSSLCLRVSPRTLRLTSPRPMQYYHTTHRAVVLNNAGIYVRYANYLPVGVFNELTSTATVRHMPWCCASRSVVRKSTWWHSTFAPCYAQAPVYHHKSYHAESCTQTRDTESTPIRLSRLSGTGDSDCAEHARRIARLGLRLVSVPTLTFFPFRTDLLRQ